MSRAESCTSAGADIAVSRHRESRDWCPPSAGTVDASLKPGVTSPEVRQAIDCSESSGDPRKGKLQKSLCANASPDGAMPARSPWMPIPVPWSFMAPCKVAQFGALVSLVSFLPFAVLLRATRTRHCEVAPRPCRPVLPSCRATAFGRRPNEPGTHLFDETFGGEECAAERCERRENTCRIRPCNTVACCADSLRH